MPLQCGADAFVSMQSAFIHLPGHVRVGMTRIAVFTTESGIRTEDWPA